MEETKKSAAEHFAANPTDKKYFVTRDGQCFKTWHEANEHSKTLGATEADRKVEEIDRADVEELIKETSGEESAAGKPAPETLTDKINACTTVEAVEALIKNNTPKAIKEIAAAKIEALKNA